MTKRAYVKPEWHAMGMPVAAAQDVGPMALCEFGEKAGPPYHDYPCRGGGGAIVTCRTGTNVGNNCEWGGGFNE